VSARLAGWLFAGPALLVIALFFGVPVLAALALSLTDFDIYALADIDNLRFVGIGNYIALLQNPLFWKALGNTFYFVLVGVPLSIAASLGAALLLSAPEYQQPHRAEICGYPADFQNPHDPFFRNHGLDLFQRKLFKNGPGILSHGDHVVTQCFCIDLLTEVLYFIRFQRIPCIRDCRVDSLLPFIAEDLILISHQNVADKILNAVGVPELPAKRHHICSGIMQICIPNLPGNQDALIPGQHVIQYIIRDGLFR
jgi:hypothetical protein